MEVKGLVAVLPFVRVGSSSPCPQIWSKWTTTALDIKTYPSIVTHKSRRLRKFDACTTSLREIRLDERETPTGSERWPELGCDVELTRVVVGDGEPWWTLGFEAFGPYDGVQAALLRAVEGIARESLDVSGGVEMSYPAWLGAFSLT
jgi:hypothetical protein